MSGRLVRRLVAPLCRPLPAVSLPAVSLLTVSLLTLALAGCGGGSADPDPAAAVGSTAAAGGAPPAGEGLPGVSGEYGDKPVLSVPDADPAAELRSAILRQGDGPEVAPGDLLVVDYLGQIWAGGEPEVFDNSYDRGVPTAFPIGTGGVIKAWDEVLVGVKAGSRVLMSVPPDKGYGEKGNPPTIESTDTLIFVVDVIASYNNTSPAAPGTPTGVTGAGGVAVTGDAAGEPAVTIPAGTPPPRAPSVTVLSQGTGKAVAGRSTVVANLVVSSWDGSQQQSSWDKGPQPLTVGDPAAPSPLDILVGVPVGSRVLLLLPPPAGQDPAAGNQDPATASVAAVIDVLGAPGPAKENA